MRTVKVDASRSYNVEIGSNILPQLGEKIAALANPAKICLVSDDNVWPLYGEKAEQSLKKLSRETCHFVFPAGEASKCGSTYLELLNFLAENRLSRKDMIVALGGGVVGDLAGFAAATYLRGIAFVQVPTTLLAAVDSSVGGKTAIDLPAGKNLAGAFCQPALVLCDTDCLDTLPRDIFLDGCGEIIKTAVLFDEELFAKLQRQGEDFCREEIIACCVAHKRDTVQKDEFEQGERQKLNLGHTLGHGVESLSNFTLSHGKAVAIGLAMIARAAAARGMCSRETAQQIQDILSRFDLPLKCDYDAESLYRQCLADKKRSNDQVNLIIPQKIAHCIIYPLPVNQLKDFIQAGL